VRDVAHLAALQTAMAARNPPLRHTTRNTPKRAAELCDGGSIYWVIGGAVLVRQRILNILPETESDGSPCAALVLDPALVRVEARAMRAFQGWRYLKPEDAPADLNTTQDTADMPETMRRELAALGLL
jgi:hypothetical protein